MRREQYGHQVGGYRRGTVNSVEPPRAGSLTGSRRRHARRDRGAGRRWCASPAPTVRVAPWPADPRTAQLTVLPGRRRRRRRPCVRAALAEAAASRLPGRRHRCPRRGRARPPFLDAGLRARRRGCTCSSARSTTVPGAAGRGSRSGASAGPSGRRVAAVDATRLRRRSGASASTASSTPAGPRRRTGCGSRPAPTTRSSATPCSAAAAGGASCSASPSTRRSHGRGIGTDAAARRPPLARRPWRAVGAREHPDRQRTRPAALPPHGLPAPARAAGRARPPARRRDERRSAPSLATRWSWRPPGPRAVRRAGARRQRRHRPRLTLVAQDLVVAPGGTVSFTFSVRRHRARRHRGRGRGLHEVRPPPGPTSRQMLAGHLRNRDVGFVATSLDLLPPDALGRRTISLPTVTTPQERVQGGNALLPDAGMYPVTIELRADNEPLAQLASAVVRLDGAPAPVPARRRPRGADRRRPDAAGRRHDDHRRRRPDPAADGHRRAGRQRPRPSPSCPDPS